MKNQEEIQNMFALEVELFCNEVVRELPKETRQIMVESLATADQLCLIYYVESDDRNPME